MNNTDVTTDGDVAKPAMPSENVASKDRKLQKSASPLQDVKVTEALNSDGQLAPVLMEKLGYFLLGDKKDANQTSDHLFTKSVICHLFGDSSQVL